MLDFNRQTSWELPAERGDTLSGLIFNLLGRAPRSGDVVEVPGCRIAEAEVSGTRIVCVLVRREEPPDSEATAR